MWASLFTCSFRHLSLYNPVYFTLIALPCSEQLHFQSAVAPYICWLPGWTAQVWAVLEVCSAPFSTTRLLWLFCSDVCSVDAAPPWKSDSQDVDLQKDFSLIMSEDLSQSLPLLKNKNDVVDLSDQKYIFLFLVFFCLFVCFVFLNQCSAVSNRKHSRFYKQKGTFFKISMRIGILHNHSKVWRSRLWCIFRVTIRKIARRLTTTGAEIHHKKLGNSKAPPYQLSLVLLWPCQDNKPAERLSTLSFTPWS